MKHTWLGAVFASLLLSGCGGMIYGSENARVVDRNVPYGQPADFGGQGNPPPQQGGFNFNGGYAGNGQPVPPPVNAGNGYGFNNGQPMRPQTGQAPVNAPVAANVPPPDAVFTSPYLRTQQTAAPFLQLGSLKNQILPNLHEFNYLSYEHIHGKNSAELSALAEAYWQRNDADYRDGADCDSFASFFGQINAMRDYFHRQPAGNYVVFGHGFWIGVLLWQLIGRGGGCHMAAFRSFEPHVRPRNTEVFLWQLGDAAESIVKVRRLAD